MHYAYLEENEFPNLDGSHTVAICHIEGNPELAILPTGAIPVEPESLPPRKDQWRWAIEKGRVVVDKTRKRPQKTLELKAEEANRALMFEGMDLISNWLASENEFQIPAKLKSFVMAWQGRKPKKEGE